MTPDGNEKIGLVKTGPGEGAAQMLLTLWRERKLVVEMTRRELVDTHAGQAAGAVWLVVHPILQFLVFAVLFTIVFQVRIAGRDSGDYLVYLFAGLPSWLVMQDIIMRSSSIVIANQNIVKKVMFPIEVIAAKTFAASLVVQMVLMACALLYIFAMRGPFHSSYLLLPVVFMMHIMIAWGICLFLSAITPFFRDTGEIVRVLITVNVYFLPCLYPPDAAPAGLRLLILLNPFSHLIWCYQDVLYFNTIRHPVSWVVAFVFAIVVFLIGSRVFSRLKHYFSSVL